MHYRCYGRVQNVGFRYHASRLARALRMTGYVCNCEDGSVEMELQGEEEAFGTFFRILDQDSYIRITRTESKRMEVQPHEMGFSVRYED
jgi:acylphosphatase